MTDRATPVPAAAGAVPLSDRLDWLRSMREIRSFEGECHRLFAQGLVRGSTHLCDGQEAVVVGAAAVTRPGDTMTCTYRGHGAVLAMGAPLDRTFSEILGKADGLCGGKGGSMHLTDVSVGALGSFAIVGAHLPISTGAAFAARYRETGALNLCFFGDGATNIGAFHEALNLAAVWALPVIFVCENNLYGEYSPIASTTPVERLADRASSYDMPGVRIDGNDVGAVFEALSTAAERARRLEGPTLIEAMTYRQRGHSRSDPGAYRPEGELERWLERDPILLLEHALRGDGVSREQLEGIREEAEAAVGAALDRAMAAPDPDADSRLDHVFA
jgi:acetoin:2,6-dichlorophenolindophenol oxidoreductase subunit alpha